ncbi:CDP-diacylglycerol--glycerol-3-phosphate 3-phosphatidyltransferase [hydrothermal vent metagenome]|uniref:CDP-diacylglycerol--glycerol-3-phosphate 3-phosphatidyltransferase n=1 Tax=hydrothermal vent metagenome TaxID=652676 RepID=A0A3B0QT98_9ZZZZ
MQDNETQENIKEDLWNLPNKLSAIRLAASPVLIVLLLYPGRTLSVIAALVFILASVTDWLDGYIARRSNMITVLGKFLDPLADKLLIASALIMLIPLGRVPAWMVALIVSREIAITGLRTVAVMSKVVIPASTLGKAKTVFQIAALIALILHYPFFGIDFHALGILLLWLALIATLYSGMDYLLKFFRK